MNSLNIITSRVSPPPSPTQPRFNGLSSAEADLGSDEKSLDAKADDDDARDQAGRHANGSFDDRHAAEDEKATETSTLLEKSKQDDNCRASWWHAFPRNLAASIVSPIRWILATLASPGVYLMACLYDDEGNFAPFLQLKKLFGVRRGGRGDYAAAAQPCSTASGWRHGGHAHRPALSSSSSGSSTSGASSESEAEELKGAKAKHNKSEAPPASAEELGTGRRSIRIKLQHDSGVGQRKHRRALSAVARTKASEEELSAQLKSPTSPIAALTRYPKTPAPPRPLIPRRQPSYLNFEVPLKQQKTLILDLDETLIHSMSKGGRMSTGHMVEVRLNTASLGMGSGPGGAAQHPILYWVNKRPYCDEFLRRVCKWFNLVIFTASVQEYADPVIDWLESERKFFSARYYRQHCTYRQGAYIKDLSSVEPDLSKVMILDNSPLSYLFHQDNAIPIQGWINDPTDNDLMHLVPLLEGLQYVHDVRALLALRGGEDGQHMA
ncbi:NLI interacting factor-like phosphatase domain-containing protein [Hirsutella rhossiliensis]